MKCSSCGELNPAGSTSCKSCGKNFNGDTFKPIPPPQPPPPPPPPGYPPYPQYPYPPPQFRPSFYDGLYAQEPEEPRLRFDVLPKVLFNPKEAFLDIHNHTTKVQGIIMVIILTMIQAVITIGFFQMTGIYSTGVSTTDSTNSSFGYFFSYSIVGIPFAVLSVFLVGHLSALFSREMGGGRNDSDKTIGLLGYGTIVTVALALIQLTLLFLALGNLTNETDPYMDSARFNTYFGIIILMAIIGFVWGLWVNGTAVSVANDISIGRGILAYFISSIIIGFMIGFIVLAFVFAFIFTLF